MCFTYQHVDSLYALVSYQLTENIVVRSGQMFDNVQRAVFSHQRNTGVDRIPSFAKKRLLRKKYGKPFLSSFQDTIQLKPVDQSLQNEFNKKDKKFELNVIEAENFFLDGSGTYSSTSVTFESKSL